MAAHGKVVECSTWLSTMHQVSQGPWPFTAVCFDFCASKVTNILYGIDAARAKEKSTGLVMARRSFLVCGSAQPAGKYRCLALPCPASRDEAVTVFRYYYCPRTICAVEYGGGIEWSGIEAYASNNCGHVGIESALCRHTALVAALNYVVSSLQSLCN